jgi:hypothetical protein
MDTINEKMPGEYFWGVFVPGAFTTILLYFAAKLYLPQLVALKPSGAIIQAIIFAGFSYITGLFIMQAASWLERKYHLRGNSYFPFTTLLENRRYGLWLELFNKKSYENLGFYIKKSESTSDSSVVRINTQSFFHYCRYLLDKNNLLQKALNLQGEYFLFRNISFALAFSALFCFSFILSRLLGYEIQEEGATQVTSYATLITGALISLLLGYFFFRVSIKKRLKYTEEVYRTAYYLLKGI